LRFFYKKISKTNLPSSLKARGVFLLENFQFSRKKEALTVLHNIFNLTQVMAVDVILGLQWGDEGKGSGRSKCGAYA